MTTQTRTPKNTEKLFGRFGLDFAALRSEMLSRAGYREEAVSVGAPTPGTAETNPALMRLKALSEREQPELLTRAPVSLGQPNWTPLGPLAVPNIQTYGGARVLISGRVTAIVPHPSNQDIVFIGTSRGGIWRTIDGCETWKPMGDDQPSLAIGALAIGTNDPNVLYAGTGEGNVQLYSTSYPLSSAPGVYLGVGILRSTDGGNTWTHHAAALLANESFYSIAIDRNDANRAFAATSRGLCRTTDGVTWTALTGGGLPSISSSVIACTDVIIDSSDSSGNTVYAAFWNSGIYKSTNALSANPGFSQIATGLPAGNTTSRISLAQSPSSPGHRYALIATSGDAFAGLYRTSNAAGTQWELCTNSAVIAVYGAFTSDVNVDPTTPDVVYVSGVELYKCERNAGTGAWAVSNVGGNIHPDSHAFGFHPTLNQTIYSGNDGGFYVSRDGGATWDDMPNEGLCLLQYEAIDNHGSSDAVIQGGTQDNGTQQYRNSPVHYHSADGDGGYCAISKISGNQVLHAYYGNTPERSTAGGRYGSYASVAAGIDGNGLFYPPADISPSSDRLVWGTSVVNIDDAMGTSGWPGTGVALAGIGGRVSAVSFSDDNTIYCATTSGQVYRLDRVGTSWTARSLHAPPLPTGQWIWDVMSLPNDVNTVLVAFSGFGLTEHVWRGDVPANGTATWTAISNGLPDVPMYALALESPTKWYVGTDIGVCRTVDAGAAWSNYSQGLPNTAVYDLRLRDGGVLLRAATHGRGLWEIRTDLGTQSTVDIFVRDHIMDTGRPPTTLPVAAAWDDPTRYITLNDPCFWWQCADMKNDAPPNWQLQPNEANYFNFETKLTHEDPEKGNQNRIYVQVHNRGPLTASNVTVKLMSAGASAGLPDLPADFWSAWPDSAGDANWTPLGAAQAIATLEPLRPEVLRWDWTPSVSADTHSCMLMVMDSPDDPIAAATKGIFNIGQLVTTEKRVGLKNLHLVNLLPSVIVPVPVYLHGSRALPKSQFLVVPAPRHRQVRVSMLLSRALSKRVTSSDPPRGLTSTKLTKKTLERIRLHWLGRELRSDDYWRRFMETFDTTRSFGLEPGVRDVALPLDIEPHSPEAVVLLFEASPTRGVDRRYSDTLTLIQRTKDDLLVGGSTFVLRGR